MLFVELLRAAVDGGEVEFLLDSLDGFVDLFAVLELAVLAVEEIYRKMTC